MSEQSGPSDKRFPLVVTAENRDSSVNKDARLVNCYLESGPGKGDYHIYKRAGTSPYLRPGGASAVGRGIYNWNGDIYSISGTTLYKNSSTIGTVDGTGGVYTFNQSLGTPTYLVLGNGVKAYTYDGTTLSQIGTSGTLATAGAFVTGTWYIIRSIGTTDFTAIGASTNTINVIFKATGSGTGTGTAQASSFPTSFVKGFVYLDQTTYVMTSKAVIQGSGLNQPNLFDPLNSLTAQIEPDGGVAIGKQLVYVVAMKQWSTEIFYDAANATGSPLGTVQGAKINYGCANADSVQDIDGSLIWLATNRNSGPQVVILEGLKIDVASSKWVEKLLQPANLASAYSFTFKDGGHKFYVLTIISANLTLVYDVAEHSWAQWTDSNGNYFPFVACTFISGTYVYRLWQHESDGYMYYASKDYTNDNGVPITADIYTPNWDGGTSKRKTLSRMFFVGDRVTGSTLKVRYSDDDYTTWTNFRNVDLSQKRPYLDRCGTFYRRALHLRHDGNQVFRISAVELQIALGSL